MTANPVLWDLDERGVATVTLNRPAVNNAYDGALIGGLLSAMDELAWQQTLRDVVIAAENSLFSITEVRWGLTAAIIVPQLCDAIGVRQVRRYALTGERFGAEEARRIGLVHEVVPLAELEAAGANVVEHLLANAPDALAETKHLALESAFDGMAADDPAWSRLVQMHAAKRQTNEAAEGLASFAEKRAARWDS